MPGYHIGHLPNDISRYIIEIPFSKRQDAALAAHRRNQLIFETLCMEIKLIRKLVFQRYIYSTTFCNINIPLYKLAVFNHHWIITLMNNYILLVYHDRSQSRGWFSSFLLVIEVSNVWIFNTIELKSVTISKPFAINSDTPWTEPVVMLYADNFKSIFLLSESLDVYLVFPKRLLQWQSSNPEDYGYMDYMNRLGPGGECFWSAHWSYRHSRQNKTKNRVYIHELCATNRYQVQGQ